MMFEQWVYQPAVLDRLSGHYTDQSQKLPPEMVKQLVRARYCNVGLNTRRFVAMATFDMLLHAGNGDGYRYGARQGLSVEELFDAVLADLTGLKVCERTHYAASWYHMAIGYDAGYYGYLWSEVMAYDMFATFAAADGG